MILPGFNWLHFTDLHVGVASQDWLWPRYKTKFLDDLSGVIERAGLPDVVLFSGDLTQQASRDEFDRLDEILKEIWSRFQLLGCMPSLISVPGNHDLSWPKELEAVQLQPYWESELLRDGLMTGDAESQIKVIEGAFTQYREWRERVIASGLHAKPCSEGVMTGDASYRVSVRDGTLGVIALNSTWLHLGKGNRKGKLALDPRQLLKVTEQDPDRWLAENSCNLLMTHHPVDWLHPNSRTFWHSEINPPDRFDIHLFGHMHEQDFSTKSHGGGAETRSGQGSALFGLEYLGDGTTKRIQGYSANALKEGGHGREITVWPRVLTPQRDGSYAITADTSLSLSDGVSFTRRYEKFRSALLFADSSGLTAPVPAAVSLTRSADDISSELENVRCHIEDEPSHRNVRRLELHQAVSALEQERMVWIAADWGMGEDGFLSAIQAHFGETGAPTYRLDFSTYQSKRQFLDEAIARFGASFEALCENIFTVGQAYVVLHDIPAEHGVDSAASAMVRDIEVMAALIAENAPTCRILLCTQRMPRSQTKAKIVELKALDEADVANYLRDSGPMGAAMKGPSRVSQIFRLTDGVPSRIDSCLHELEVTSLDELLGANSDLAAVASSVVVPTALANAVAGLEALPEHSDGRTLELLKVLTALPQGEQLSSIARLNGPIPFRASHALELRGRALLDTTPLIGLGAQDNATSKALIVPRPVREYIRSRLEVEESLAIDSKLLHHFFGLNWRSGEISSSYAGKRAKNSLCSTPEIVNASTLIVRLLRRAVDDQKSNDIDAAISLTSAFIECLDDGAHHRGAITLCEDVLGLLPADGRDRQRAVLEYQLGRAMRMCGMREEACKTFHSLDATLLSKDQRQSAMLNLALALQSQGEADDAAQAARDCIAISKRSGLALQAQSIIARQVEDQHQREAELTALLAKSTRKKTMSTAIT